MGSPSLQCSLPPLGDLSRLNTASAASSLTLDMPAGADPRSPSPAGSLPQAQLGDLGSQNLASVPPDSDAEQIQSPLPVGSRQVVPDSSRNGSGTSTASGQAIGTQMALGSGDGLSLRLEALRALSRLLAEDQSKQEVGAAASKRHVTRGGARARLKRAFVAM